MVMNECIAIVSVSDPILHIKRIDVNYGLGIKI